MRSAKSAVMIFGYINPKVMLPTGNFKPKEGQKWKRAIIVVRNWRWELVQLAKTNTGEMLCVECQAELSNPYLLGQEG